MRLREFNRITGKHSDDWEIVIGINDARFAAQSKVDFNVFEKDKKIILVPELIDYHI